MEGQGTEIVLGIAWFSTGYPIFVNKISTKFSSLMRKKSFSFVYGNNALQKGI